MTEAVAWYTCHVAGRVQLTSSSQETDTVTVWAVRAGTIVKVTSLALPGRVRDRDLRMLSVYETNNPHQCGRAQPGGGPPLHAEE